MAEGYPNDNLSKLLWTKKCDLGLLTRYQVLSQTRAMG